MQRIISLGKSYLSAVGKEYEGAAVLLMRVFSRHDVARLHLADTLSWALSTMQSTKSTFEVGYF